MTKQKISEGMRRAHFLVNQSKQTGKKFETDSTELAENVSYTLTEMTVATDRERAEAIVSSLISAHEEVEPSIDLWVYLCLNANWLSWAWHEQGNEEMSKIWADQWHRMNDYSLKTFKGSRLKTYIKEVD